MIKYFQIKKKYKNRIIFTFIILLVLMVKLNFFSNFYLLLTKDPNARMLSNYGYCYPMGYGYINDIINKFEIDSNKVNVINKKIYPSSAIFLNKFNSNIKNNKLEILLNYKIEDLKEINRKFSILDQQGECYLIKYNND